MKESMFVLLSLVALLGQTNAQTTIEYEHSQQLSSRYTISWTADLTNEVLSVGLNVQGTGWVGFGLGESTSGSMPGADIVVGWYDDATNKCHLEDRYALEYATPQLDTCGNWNLISCSQINGTTTLHMSRKFYTNDTQDRDIVAGNMRILWAIGSSDTLSYHGMSSDHRGIGIIEFYSDGTQIDMTIPEGALVAEYFVNSAIPVVKTSYMCQSFSLPELEDGHIIAIEPILASNSASLVHHMLVHHCEPSANHTSFWDTYNHNSSATCSSPIGNLVGGCMNLLYAWAVGVNPLYLPPQAGFRIGNNTSYGIRNIAIEIHYDNPSGLNGVIDNSGIRIYYTSKLRQHDAGMMTLGDPFVKFPEIPPQNEHVEYEADCPSACTQGWSNDITIFQDFLHMHMVGKQMWSNIWNNNSDYLGYLNKVDFYGFNFQQGTYLNKTIKRGDRINIHCVYNTMSRAESTKFGEGSQDEMCMEFIAYYPILLTQNQNPYAFCGNIYVRQSNRHGSWCGDYNATSSIRWDIPNPSVVDPPNTCVVTFGNSPTQCLSEEEDEPASDSSSGSASRGDGILEPVIYVVCVAVTIAAMLAAVFVIVRKRNQERAYKKMQI